jgi:integrase
MTKLTKKLVETSLPREKDYVIWDDEIKGFGCRIYASGYKTYVFFYTSPTTKIYSYLKIGVHGNYTVDLARDKAKKWCADIAKDIDPKENKKVKQVEIQQSVTFEEFWQVFTEKYIKQHHKPSTINRDSSRIKLYILPFFGKKTIAEIERKDILAFKDSLSNGTSAKCLILLGCAFNQAELWGYRPQNSNPCRGVPKHPGKKMNRFLSDEELGRLNQVLDENVILGLKKQADNPHVFCGNKKGTHLVTIQKIWDRIRQKAGIPDVRIHDLRHSFASFALKKGVSLYGVSKLLGHKNIATTTRYAHLELEELKKLTNIVDQAFSKCG